MTADPPEHRKACRAAINATVETLLDLDIPHRTIVEALASAAVDLAKLDAIRVTEKRRSNDDEAGS